MSFDKFIGLSGPDFDFPIELGKQREYSAAVHAFRPEFHEGKTPFMFPTLPIVAGYLWGYMLEDPKDTPLTALNMDYVVSLDAEQEFVFHGEVPRAGDQLIARTSVDSIWTKQGRKGGKLTFYKMRSDFRDAATNEPRMTVYATSVTADENPDTPPPETTASEPLAFMARSDRRDQFSAIEQAAIADLNVGDTPGPITMPPHTLTDCVRFQVTAGNYKGTHHDNLAAREMGFPTWFGIGMYHAGLLANYAVSWLPVAALARFKVRFKDATWPGDVIVYRGSVSDIGEIDGEDMVRLNLVAERSSGAPVIEGWADFRRSTRV